MYPDMSATFDMSSAFPVVLLLLVPAGIALAIWYQVHRHKTLQTWCRASGWRFVGADPSLVGRWQGEPFNAGHSRRASEVMLGRIGERPAVSFTYRYTTGSGKNQTTYTFHVLALPLPAYLPRLQLTPDGLGAKLAKVVGGQDIQFESEDFNKAWRVESRDLKFAHDVVHPRLMERLLRPDARGTSMRIEGTDILSWTTGATRTETIAKRLTLMTAVIDAVPGYVWRDHGYDPGQPGSGGRSAPAGPRPV